MAFFTVEGEGRTRGGGSGVLPAGYYEGVITRSEMRDNKPTAKDPNGKYVEIEIDVQSPVEFGNRKVWDKFNLINSTETAVRIAKEQFEDLLLALGVKSINSPEEITEKFVGFYLLVEAGTNGYKDSNKVAKYLPSGSTEADYFAWLGEAKASGKDNKGEPKKSWGTAAPAAAAKPAAPAKPSWAKPKA